MQRAHIPLIMNMIDKIVSPDKRKRKYTDMRIVKILMLLQIFHISYRSSAIFLGKHPEYMDMIGTGTIPSFQTISRRARSIDMHEINSEIASIYMKRINGCNGLFHDTYMQIQHCFKKEKTWQI